MSRRAKVWTVAFLAVTAIAIVMELIAAWDHNADTVPWTSLLVDHVDEELVYALIGALLGFLPYHLYVRYRKRQRKRQAQQVPPVR